MCADTYSILLLKTFSYFHEQFEGRDPSRYSNDWGGAFYLRGISPAESTLSLNDCILRNNVAIDSGAIENGNAAIIPIDTTFTNNAARGFGGVVYTFSGATTVFEGCQFQGNSAGLAGGVIFAFSDSSFKSCYFGENTAGIDGGIAYTYDTSTYERCYFKENSADDDGGVIYTFGDSYFDDCSFESNTAADNGGVVYTRPSGSSS